jgi:hypothetical protein
MFCGRLLCWGTQVMRAFLLALLLVGFFAPLRTGAQEPITKPQPVVRVQVTCGIDVACQMAEHVGPRDKWYIALPVTRRTADNTFWLVTTGSLLLTAADIENSIPILRDPRYQEENPIYGRHPGRGRYYGIAMPLAALDGFVSWKWKRESDALVAAGYPDHKYRKWWVPDALNGAGHVLGLVVTLAATGK